MNALTQVRSECSLLFWVNRLSSANLRGIHALATVDGALPAWVGVLPFVFSTRAAVPAILNSYWVAYIGMTSPLHRSKRVKIEQKFDIYDEFPPWHGRT